MKDLLFEIGCEEIPASYIDPALAWLAENAAKELKEARLAFGAVSTLGTPRRLVLIVRGLAEAQEDLTSEILGPRAEQAWDGSGNLTPQAKGFLSAKKIDEKAAYRKETPKGEVLAAKIFEKGKSAGQVLSELLPRLIASIPFPKTMRWEASGAVFARPIRWLLAIHGAEKINCAFADVTSDTKTTGHRFLSPEWVQVSSVENYLELMSQKSVMLSSDQRRSAIKQQAEALAKAQGGELVVDEALLDIVKNLVEYPWPLVGKFEPRYLEIPKEILISEMREHQKYFAVHDKTGKLLPCFIVVAGSKPQNAQSVADGHARVLRARFEDGSFYYYEDLKQPFGDSVARLERVQFQRELGSMLEKVQRIESLTARLADELKLSGDVKSEATKSAHLCKADLVSGVVAQFPELQGVMGSYYAQKSGEKPEVAQGIREHYLPRFAGDQLPSSDIGSVLSLTDKLDTLVGVIGVGKAPKGNADPFGLRRAAIAVTRIIVEKGYRLSLRHLVSMSIENYGSRLKATPQLQDEIVAFILGRARGVFAAPSTVVDAAIAAKSDDLADLSARIEALHKLQTENADMFALLAATFKRAGNIVSKAIADKAFDSSSVLNASLLEAASEKQLLAELEKAKHKLDQVGATRSQDELRSSYVEVMQEIAKLKPHVDRFFDDVMVMSDDAALRSARLALLYRLQSAVNVVADFTKIQL